MPNECACLNGCIPSHLYDKIQIQILKICSARWDIATQPRVKKIKVKVVHDKKGSCPTMMHIWCEYGQCNLNRSEVIALTRCYNLEGQGHDREDEGQGHPQYIAFLSLPLCEYGESSLNRSGDILLTR